MAINRAWWEHHYRVGGHSGQGSVGKYRDWKWGVIELYVSEITDADIIDVGCGDLTFWEGRNCAKYLGIDWSEFIIAKNRELRAGWSFTALPAEQYIPGITAMVVFCFDLLIHIEKAATFRKIIENLCRYSKDLIFVYGWNDPHLDDGWSCFYHPLEAHMDVFRQARFRLLARHDDIQGIGAIYVFRKEREVI